MVAISGTRSTEQNQKEKVGFLMASVEDGITATPSGTQSTSYQLTSQINRISVCATGADGVKLPLAEPGMAVTVINDGAAAAQVFGTSPDTIDGVATATGVALTNAKRATFFCVVAGKWQSMLGAVST